MLRLLAGVALAAVLALPGAASTASASERAASLNDTDVGAARRCVCSPRRSAHVRVIRRSSRRVAVRLPLRIGYDPLPYRFGYYSPPYRYIHRYAVVRVRPAAVYQ